jgi:hypothetical protein
MAKSPRQSGRSVGLTPKTAKRIQRAVLKVERGGKDMQRPHLRTAGGDDALVLGNFSGLWDKGATKTVTDATVSAVTYEAKNYVASLLPSGNMVCQLAYSAGEWVLVSWDWQSLSGYSGSTQQVLTHNTSGQLVWVDTTACTQ